MLTSQSIDDINSKPIGSNIQTQTHRKDTQMQCANTNATPPLHHTPAVQLARAAPFFGILDHSCTPSIDSGISTRRSLFIHRTRRQRVHSRIITLHRHTHRRRRRARASHRTRSRRNNHSRLSSNNNRVPDSASLSVRLNSQVVSAVASVVGCAAAA